MTTHKTPIYYNKIATLSNFEVIEVAEEGSSSNGISRRYHLVGSNKGPGF